MVASQNNTILIAVAGMVTHTGMALVPPADLPSEYLRTDNRVLWMLTRSIKHTCSYPGDTFTCKALEKIPYERVGKAGDMGFPCGSCNNPLPYTIGTFCSGKPVNGSWLVKLVRYHDEQCTQPYPFGGPDVWSYPADEPLSCDIPGLRGFEGKCSATHPLALCMDYRPGQPGYPGSCPIYGSNNKTKCDAVPCVPDEELPCPPRTDPQCVWSDGGEKITAYQTGYTLLAPSVTSVINTGAVVV